MHEGLLLIAVSSTAVTAIMRPGVQVLEEAGLAQLHKLLCFAQK